MQEIKIYPPPIEGVNTSNVAFLGETETGPTTPTLVTSFIEYQRVFGGYFGECKYLPYAVEGFFLNGGRRCYVCRVADSNYTSALAKLEVVDVSIIYSPNAQTEPGLTNALINHCEQLRNRFLILDSLKGQNPSSVTKPSVSSFAALYYPWIYVKEATKGQLCLVPLGGHVAGIYARMDIEVGVHMAPANQIVKGAVGLEVTMKSYQIDSLSSQGINTVRNFAGRGLVVWGARTLSIDPTKKFVSFCRLMIYLEQSIKKGIAWTVFEPNNEITWVKVKTSIENFLTQAWRSGMLLGIKQQEAFFVECGRNTMTQDDIDNGRLIVLIGVAPIKPAEFVILSISQKTAVS